MAVIVPRNDLKTGTDGESDQRHERILEPHAIYVVLLGASNDIAHLGVTCDQAIENCQVDTLGDWRRLPPRAAAALLRRRLDVPPNEPAPEPAREDLLDRSRPTVA